MVSERLVLGDERADHGQSFRHVVHPVGSIYPRLNNNCGLFWQFHRFNQSLNLSIGKTGHFDLKVKVRVDVGVAALEDLVGYHSLLVKIYLGLMKCLFDVDMHPGHASRCPGRGVGGSMLNVEEGHHLDLGRLEKGDDAEEETGIGELEP